MAQAQYLTLLLVARCQFMQHVYSAHIGHTAFFKVYNHFGRIMYRIKFFCKSRGRAEEQWSVNLVMLYPVFIDILAGTNAFGIIPGKYQRGNDHTG
ncbi:hypothetical protein D3C80_1696280 [compost metagenome]